MEPWNNYHYASINKGKALYILMGSIWIYSMMGNNRTEIENDVSTVRRPPHWGATARGGVWPGTVVPLTSPSNSLCFHHFLNPKQPSSVKWQSLALPIGFQPWQKTKWLQARSGTPCCRRAMLCASKVFSFQWLQVPRKWYHDPPDRNLWRLTPVGDFMGNSPVLRGTRKNVGIAAW